MMTKDQIIIQRTIGKILTKLNEQDGIMLTQYMAMLEELVYDLKMTPKPTILFHAYGWFALHFTIELVSIRPYTIRL